MHVLVIFFLNLMYIQSVKLFFERKKLQMMVNISKQYTRCLKCLWFVASWNNFILGICINCANHVYGLLICVECYNHCKSHVILHYIWHQMEAIVISLYWGWRNTRKFICNTKLCCDHMFPLNYNKFLLTTRCPIIIC